MSKLSDPPGLSEKLIRFDMMKTLDNLGKNVTYPVIGVIAIMMVSIIMSNPVWVWINNDEEEDTVRFRQRLSFTVFWSIMIGLVHVRNTFVIKKV